MTDVLRRYNPRQLYSDMAEEYDRTSADFWRFSVPGTLARARPRPGETVLDVACGPGPAALAAAEAVGPSGRVVGLDVSPEMVDRARANAREAGLTNVSFEVGSMDDRPVHPGRFDLITCVFGLFFARDIVGTLASLRQSLNEGGRLAVATCGRTFYSPMFDVLVEAVRREDPGIDTDMPFVRTEDPRVMARYFREAGFRDAAVELEVSRMAMPRPEDWWRIVTHSGIRRVVTELDDAAAARVREQNLRWIRDQGVTSVDLGVVYILAGAPVTAPV